MHSEIVRDEPSGVYHAVDAITSTAVREYLKCPQAFRDYMDGIRRGYTDALGFGVATHYMMLEPDKFAAHYAIKPDGLSLATKEGKTWKESNAGKESISYNDYQDLRRMSDRMPDQVREIFKACEKEVTVRVKVDGLTLQCRPDLWDQKNGRKYDLKTIKDIESIDGTIWKRGYHIQDRWYTHVIKEATGEKTKVSDLIFVEKQPPYRWRIVSMDPDYQSLADQQIGIALRGISERMKTGVWSDTEDDIWQISSPPDWMTEHFDLTTNDEE